MIAPRPPASSPRSAGLRRIGRRLRFAARLAETWVRRPDTPTRAVFDVTRRCNLRCSMCRTWARTVHDELSVAEYRRLFAALPRLCWVDLTGGEPLLRPDFGEIVAAALTALPALGVLHFQTNGWARRRAERIVADARRTRPEVDLIVTVSIDGPPDVHDAIRGRPGSYARAIETLAALHRRATGDPGLQVHVGTTVTAANGKSFERVGAAVREQISEFPISHWHLNLGQRSAHFFDNAQAPGVEPAIAPAAVRAAVQRHLVRRGLPRDPVGVMEAIYLINLGAVADGAPSKIPCQALRSSLFVSPEGDVYPCHLWDRPLGNVRRTPVRTLWHAERTMTARRDVEALACGGCFSACEAYPALAGAPIRTTLTTLRRATAGIGA